MLKYLILTTIQSELFFWEPVWTFEKLSLLLSTKSVDFIVCIEIYFYFSTAAAY